MRQDTIVTPPPPPPGTPPGTVHIKARIISFTQQENKHQGVINLKILQILEVGAATPLVAKNDTVSAKTSALPYSLKKGEEIIGRLSHRKVLADFKESASAEWVLVGIKKSRNQTH